MAKKKVKQDAGLVEVESGIGLEEIEGVLASEEIVMDDEVATDELEGLEEFLDEAKAAAPVEADDAEIEDLEGEIAAHEAKEEAYAEQESDGDVDMDAKPIDRDVSDEPAAEKPEKVSKPRAPKFEKTSEALMHKLGDKANDLLALTAADADKSFETRAEEIGAIVDNDLAKKVKEKAVNLYDAIANGRSLSNYTQIAVKKLFEAEGAITAKDIFDAILATPKPDGTTYGEGTARSQSHQMTQLFNALKITTPDGKAIAVNEDSVLAPVLKDLVAA